MLHLERVRFAHVGGVDDDQGVLVDEASGVVDYRGLYLRRKAFGLQVSAETVLDVAMLLFRVDGAGYVREDRVASRLYPVDHVADELVLRLGKTVKHFHHKIIKLCSRFPGDYAIIHVAVLSFVLLLHSGIIPEQAEKRAAFCFSSRGQLLPVAVGGMSSRARDD